MSGIDGDAWGAVAAFAAGGDSGAAAAGASVLAGAGTSDGWLAGAERGGVVSATSTAEWRSSPDLSRMTRSTTAHSAATIIAGKENRIAVSLHEFLASAAVYERHAAAP
jgi:hypothetical protein